MMRRGYFFTYLIVAAVALVVLPVGNSSVADAQNQPFGGRFTVIQAICCDGTLLLQHQAASSDLPQGTFKTSWSMDAYRELFYYPLPQTCALGFVRPGGSCQTVSSECLGSRPANYTITTIGSSFPGCQLQSSASGGVLGGDGGDSTDGGDSGGGDTGGGGDGTDDGDDQNGDLSGGPLRLIDRISNEEFEEDDIGTISHPIMARGGAGAPYELEVLYAEPPFRIEETDDGSKRFVGRPDDGYYTIRVQITDREGNTIIDAYRVEVDDDD